MNKKLETLLERVSAWPQEAQEELADITVVLEQRQSGIVQLNEEERAAVRRGLQELREGKLATDQQVAEVFDRYRR